MKLGTQRLKLCIGFLIDCQPLRDFSQPLWWPLQANDGMHVACLPPFLKVEVPSILTYSQCYAVIPQRHVLQLPLCRFVLLVASHCHNSPSSIKILMTWIDSEEPQRWSKLSFATFQQIQFLFFFLFFLNGNCVQQSDISTVVEAVRGHTGYETCQCLIWTFGLPMGWCFNVTVKESWLPVVTEWVYSQSVSPFGKLSWQKHPPCQRQLSLLMQKMHVGRSDVCKGQKWVYCCGVWWHPSAGSLFHAVATGSVRWDVHLT